MYHVIDPTFFYDAINEFSFNYTLYVVSGKTVNEYGKRVLTYTQQVVSGSLQSQGSQVVRSKTGKTDTKIYKFYCKSLYRVNKDDVLYYNNEYFVCTGVQDYDEYGVREATFELVQLTQYRDLADYVKYLQGVKLV